ncbi:hypothetical protein MBLNU13_g00317t2 [Cladosporium sp. NU13]
MSDVPIGVQAPLSYTRQAGSFLSLPPDLNIQAKYFGSQKPWGILTGDPAHLLRALAQSCQELCFSHDSLLLGALLVLAELLFFRRALLGTPDPAGAAFDVEGFPHVATVTIPVRALVLVSALQRPFITRCLSSPQRRKRALRGCISVLLGGVRVRVGGIGVTTGGQLAAKVMANEFHDDGSQINTNHRFVELKVIRV